MHSILFTTLLFLWIAFLGGAVGSFLNVVVYRLPLGMSIVHPPSSCPRCGHSIRWFDNIPILGWLWLRGRCRDCQAPISARYPLVEAITAAAFVLVAWVDGLPQLGLGTLRGGTVHELMLAGNFLLHAALLSTLWTAALMQYDGNLPPGRMVIGLGVILCGGTMGLMVYASQLPFHRFNGPPHTVAITNYFWNPYYMVPLAMPFNGIMSAAFAMVLTFLWTHHDDERSRSRWTFAELAGICGLVIPLWYVIEAMVAALLFGLGALLVRRLARRMPGRSESSAATTEETAEGPTSPVERSAEATSLEAMSLETLSLETMSLETNPLERGESAVPRPKRGPPTVVPLLCLTGGVLFIILAGQPLAEFAGRLLPAIPVSLSPWPFAILLALLAIGMTEASALLRWHSTWPPIGGEGKSRSMPS